MRSTSSPSAAPRIEAVSAFFGAARVSGFSVVPFMTQINGTDTLIVRGREVFAFDNIAADYFLREPGEFLQVHGRAGAIGRLSAGRRRETESDGGIEFLE